jgi:hypothetical protein
MWKTGEADRFFRQLELNKRNNEGMEFHNNSDSDDISI